MLEYNFRDFKEGKWQDRDVRKGKETEIEIGRIIVKKGAKKHDLRSPQPLIYKEPLASSKGTWYSSELMYLRQQQYLM